MEQFVNVIRGLTRARIGDLVPAAGENPKVGTLFHPPDTTKPPLLGALFKSSTLVISPPRITLARG
jgi:hypothetical protein